ncbi:hypothetical protein MesoLj131b_67290 [Mesorhizobium sp. 131-2-5]|nr:hypothetical protein MesoLj131b_67290 [Mesorhizobium sp. 131-2-5]
MALSGCASLPKLQTDIGLLRISDIVDNIRCDLKDGRDGNEGQGIGPATFLTEANEWNAAIELTLNVVAEANGNGGAGNDIPYIPRTASLALATNVTGTADRQVGYKFTVALGPKDPIVCSSETVVDRRKHSSRLVGDLGIAQWLAQLQDAYAETKTKPDSASYVLGFTLLQSAEASVKIVKIPFNSSAATLGLGWKGSWKDVNKISIVFAPKETKAPTKPVAKPIRATPLPKGQDKKEATPPPPAVDPGAKDKLLQDLQFLMLQQNLKQ